MRLRDFVKANRKEIDEHVSRLYGRNCKPTNDSEREDWVRNDENLYRWAQRNGANP